MSEKTIEEKMKNKVLDVNNLRVNFNTYEGVVKALKGVSFDIRLQETFGLVGETGCGKSVTAKSIMRLIEGPGEIYDGEILFRREENGFSDITKLTDKETRSVRGDEISIVFQEPGEALNPVHRSGRQIKEAIMAHQTEKMTEQAIKDLKEEINEKKGFRKSILKTQLNLLKRYKENKDSLLVKYASKMPLIGDFKEKVDKKAKEKVFKLLKDVEIPEPEQVYEKYPHELSGGMKQRVVIAIALASEPVLLIADEPTSSLDVSIQSKILKLLEDLKKEHKLSILYITHNLSVVAEICDRVGVMYAGRVVEIADVKRIFENPLHPYTMSLIEAIPSRKKDKLEPIGGYVPNLINPPKGCRFHPRCPKATDICKQKQPEIEELETNHFVECYHPGDIE